MQLSIIVPVYNMTGGGKLNYCLDSLLAQKLVNLHYKSNMLFICYYKALSIYRSLRYRKREV